MSGLRSVFIVISLSILMLSLNSCLPVDNDGNDQEAPEYLTGLFTFHIDGSNQHAYEPTCDDLDCHTGVITAMHDNLRFILCNEHLFIFNTLTHTITSYLKNTSMDYSYNGLERIGLSYDDRYVVYGEEHELFLLDLVDDCKSRLTSDCFDLYPSFSVDSKIYFCRYDRETDHSALLVMDMDGENVLELCNVDGQITQIFPGQNDLNFVFFISDLLIFWKVNLTNKQINLLYEFDHVNAVIARTSDDHYFSFSGYDVRQYCFDTTNNEMTEYLYPQYETGDYISKIIPGTKQALIYQYLEQAKLMRWDIDSNAALTEGYIIDETSAWGGKTLAISPDGNNVAIFYHYYNFNHYFY